MRALTYFLSLLLALPLAAFALGILAVGHAVATRNVFKLVYHFFLAFGWGLPALVICLLSLVVAGFFPTPRFAASLLLLALNAAAVCLILASPASPRKLSEAFFFLPALLSALLAGLLVVGPLRPRGSMEPGGAQPPDHHDGGARVAP